MIRILLIENNFEIRKNATKILSHANYKVFSAENGKDGVSMAHEVKPDLIICETAMPEFDAHSLSQSLRKKPSTAKIPFIFLFAQTEKRVTKFGTDDYLKKPFDESELLHIVKSRLPHYSTQTKQKGNGYESFEEAKHTLDFTELCKDKKIEEFKKKSSIFREGDLPLSVFFVKGGSVKIFKSNQDGKEFILDVYRENDFFGFEPILEDVIYNESAVASENSQIVVIPKSDFLNFVHSHQTILNGFIGLLCNKVANRERQLLSLAYGTTRQRIAESLMKLVEDTEGNCKIQIRRDDLSKMVGTAPESAIRVLSDFKTERLIEIESGKIKVIHPLGLRKVIHKNVALKTFEL